MADVEGRGAADVADAAERGRGHEDPSGCLRKTRDRAQQKVDSSVLAHVFKRRGLARERLDGLS
nr:MAG TPA: hypothetical protein [Caudoviricetes sp.]